VSEQRERRPADGAAFAGAVPGRPGRPPVFVLAFVVVLLALVAVGFGGRVADPGPSAAAPAALASPATSQVPSPPAGSQVASPPAGLQVPSPPVFPALLTSEPGGIALTVVPNRETIFIHGDVFARRVTWIYVALQDRAGRIAGWASVTMPEPGTSPSAASGEPTLRFNVELAVPSAVYPGTIFVVAHAYEADGGVAAAARVEVSPIDGGTNASGTDAAGAIVD
jgi:hypothetical protein